MFISELKIQGFRGIESGSLTLNKFAILIGLNNSGKTTLVEALALLLGRDRLIRNLTEHDFFGSSPDRAQRISLIATITGFQPNDPERQTEWFRTGRAIPKWRDLSSGKLKPLSDKPDDELACQIAFAARFDHETLEVETVRYFCDDESSGDPFDEATTLTIVPKNVIADVGFFLIPASRTWDRMISFGSELFRRVVNYVGGRPAEAVLSQRDQLRQPDRPLEQDPKLSDLISEVESDLAGLLGQTTKLKLRITTTDSDGVLEAITPHYSHGVGTPLPARRHGSGLLSLQTLALLMRFGRLRIANEQNFLLVVEEPELHIPPPQQRNLIHLLQSIATQAIVTSHSPTVAAVAPPHQLILVSNANGQFQARPLLTRPLDVAATNLQRGLFLSDREATVGALLHPFVLVPEGKLDARWFRLLARLVDYSPERASQVFTHEVGVVSTRDASIVATFALLNEVHSRVVCLVDGDSQGDEYARQLAKLPSPPSLIIRWPDGWNMEQVIAWIVSADSTILADQQLKDARLPSSLDQFREEISGAPLKQDELRHELLADAMSSRKACVKRVTHLLKAIADICASRPEAETYATPAATSNPNTMLWKFRDGIPGL